MALKLNSTGGGSVTLDAPNTASNVSVTVPATAATLLTDSSGVMNIGSGQIYKDSSGNVGIGTSSPSTTLHVARSSGAPYVRVSRSTQSQDNAGFQIDGGTGGTTWLMYQPASSNDLRFYGAAADRMTLDSSGNLFVGKSTSAAQGWQISSGGTGNAVFGVTTNEAFTYNNTTTGAGNYYDISLRTNNVARGYIRVTDSATTYSTSSDYRLKDNITPMVNAMSVVQQLNPVTYTWKVDGSEGQGFIAHELQAVVPECVTGEKDAVDDEGNPVYQGIDTSFLVATLAKAIQELSAKNDALEARIAALEAK